MANNLFTVYKSSAGSGKTFTLTREYLKLALRYPDQFKKILAVTFTNKATQEMKERIILNLFHFSRGNTSGMGSQLMELVELDTEQLQKASQALLTNILHNYSRFSVQTIDRFFQNVMRSFARELSIQGDGELLLNTDEVRNDVVDLLMEDLSINQPLRDWLLAFSIDKLEQKGKWDVRRDVLSFTKELMSDDFKFVEQALGDAISDYDKLKDFKSKIFNVTRQFETDLDRVGKEALQLIASRGLSVTDFSYGVGSAANFFNKIQKDSKDYEIKARVLTAIETEGASLASKTSKRKEEILSVAQAGLLQYFEEAISYIEQNLPVYLSAQNIAKNIYLLGISWQFNQRMQSYKQEEGIQFLSDTTQFLNEIIGTDPAESPFVYEKMGSFYDNFLMDEFQDTSTLQWQNFKPLIENSLAEGNENLVVGDIKQSIYRWRGGDWRLLLKGLKEDIPAHFYQEKSLDNNFRSKPNVIDFNNQLFEALPGLIRNYALTRKSNSFSQEAETLLNDLEMAYADVAQEKQKSYTYAGYVSFRFFEDFENGEGESVSWKQKALQQFVHDLEELQDAGIKLKDIGILVRKKSEGIELQDFLEEYKLQHPDKAIKYQYDIISDETLMLGNAHIVNFILNCFLYLYTEDEIALAQIKLYYQKALNARDLVVHEIVKASGGESFLPKAFVEAKKQLLSLNLMEMSERLIQLFELKNIQQEKAYLSAFQDVLLDFGNKGGIPDFLEWWENNQNSYAIKLQTGKNAARMMTIHKSKGLEFKVCMIPLLDWLVTHHPTMAPVLWVNTENTQFSEVPYLPVKHSSSLKQSVFSIDYWQEEVKSFLDNLNLLYVALTRAGDALIVNTAAAARGPYMSGFLKQHAEAQEEFWDAERQMLEIGTKADFKLIAEESEEENNEVVKTAHLKYYESHQWQEKLQIKQSHSLTIEKQGLSKVDLGIYVHDVFSRLKNLEELPVLLQKIKAEKMLNEADFQKVQQLVEGNLKEGSELIEWFKTDWKVKTEVPVLLPNGDLIRLDRVLLKNNEAKILDFKTGQKDVKDQKQVGFYKKSLKSMGYENVSAHIAYLDPLQIIPVN